MRLRIFIFSLIYVGLITLEGLTAYAQEREAEQNSPFQELISIYPSFVEIKPGDRFEIFIENLSASNLELKPEVILLSIDTNVQNLIPTDLDSELLQSQISEYLQIEESELYVESGNTGSIHATYLKPMEEHVFAIKFVQNSLAEGDIVISAELAAVVLDTYLTDEEIGKINSEIIISSNLSISKFSLGNNFDIETEIFNGSGKLVQTFGEVRVLSGSTRLDNFVLNESLKGYFYPNKEIIINNNFKDTRPFYKRIGKLEFEQTIKVNDKEFLVKSSTFVIPYEIVIIVPATLVITGIFYSASRKYWKRMRK